MVKLSTMITPYIGLISFKFDNVKVYQFDHDGLHLFLVMILFLLYHNLKWISCKFKVGKTNLLKYYLE
jgi:hypothetical protein